jgi:DNA (cytosine-5)-methyltransferase 1
MKKLTVIDFFCGAGGFSEGFKQQGFNIVQGVDNWKPAIETFNHNFDLKSETQDILKFDKIKNIEALPDTDIILGSPPCVSFSNSNKCGNADKSLGVNLIETFLKIVAVKKHQPNSQLKAWFMENVTNSIKHTKDKYTFLDLNLGEWAKANNLNASMVVINFKDNQQILNSADFGVAQKRNRLFAGEVIKIKSFPVLEKQSKHKSVKDIFKYFPSPINHQQKQITDPNYKIKISNNKLTDNFYDTGVYKSHWDYSQYCKTNHPYMGKMSFPENLDNPSRTITATKLDNSREALIYKSDIKRNGDGQYRTPTVREAAVLMSFPITFQFIGASENSKWRLVGNAVCPLISSAIAKATLKTLNLPILDKPIIEKNPNLDVVNLNTFQEKLFNKPPIRKQGSRFRRHPFKVGNMTVALSNYCLKENGKSDKKWRTTVTYGTGKNYKLQEVSNKEQTKIKKLIETFDNGKEFITKIHNGFSEKIAYGKDLQDMYEQSYSKAKLHPVDLIAETNKLISQYANGEIEFTEDIFKYKDKVHKRHLYALYAVNRITQIANKRR